jgi:hypothetical protein
MGREEGALVTVRHDWEVNVLCDISDPFTADEERACIEYVKGSRYFAAYPHFSALRDFDGLIDDAHLQEGLNKLNASSSSPLCLS